jgi:MFS family permease
VPGVNRSETRTPGSPAPPSGAPPAPEPTGPAAPAPRGLKGITRNVVALGVTSLLTDVSSEMLIPVLPMFVTSTLKASVASLGIIEGVAESTASLLRLASGWLSDRVGRRQPFIVFGYGLSTAAKTAMAAAASWPAVLALRFTDRVGKGLRSPARDALIADSVEERYRGRAFGFHRGFDTLGAAIGPFAAFGVLALWPGNFRRVFLLSAIPALLSLVVLAIFVRAPRHRADKPRALHHEFRSLSSPFKRLLVVEGVFRLGCSSLAFVLLRTREAGFSAALVPVVYAAYNWIYALLSLPAGVLSDRFGRRRLMVVSYVLFAGVYALMAWRATPLVMVVAMLLLGVHSALLEVAHRALVADFVSEAQRGTAFGVFHTVVGVALLPASVVAGWLWDRFGARATFGVDAALALVAAVLFVILLPARDELRDRHHAPAS